RDSVPSRVNLACRTVRGFLLRLYAARYPVGAKRFLPVAMSVPGNVDDLVFLRGDQNSPVAPRIFDCGFSRVLPDLSFMGGNRVSFARFFHCVDGCPPGRMVVVKRVSSLPLPLFYGCRGRRSVLLADDRRRPISYGRLGAFESCRPVALFPDASLYSRILY